jgi:CRISPR/Cas system-associated protein Cas7 (RAMP superfamily)
LRTAVDAVYQYLNVPAGVWNGLVRADSKGSFVNASIAFEFQYAKVGRDELAEAAQSLPQGRVRRFLTTP